MPDADTWRSFARSVRTAADYVPDSLARDGEPTPFGAMFALFCEANATIVELREQLALHERVGGQERRPSPTPVVYGQVVLTPPEQSGDLWTMVTRDLPPGGWREDPVRLVPLLSPMLESEPGDRASRWKVEEQTARDYTPSAYLIILGQAWPR